MLVVLVVIGLIAAVALPQLMRMMGSAKHKAASIQLLTLSNALTSYQLDMDDYPSTEQGLKALWLPIAPSETWSGPYVREERQLIDPWGRPFQYRRPGTGKREFDLVTLGADGKPGGSGDDADVAAK